MPFLYRTLKKLENEGAIESYVSTDHQDKPRKMYKITPAGKEQLAHFQMDIEEKNEELILFPGQI